MDEQDLMDIYDDEDTFRDDMARENGDIKIKNKCICEGKTFCILCEGNL